MLQGDDVDLWGVAQYQPQLFSKGGAYYQQVSDQLGGQIKNNTHIQFKEFHEKVFAYSAEKERLDLCLGEWVLRQSLQIKRFYSQGYIDRHLIFYIGLIPRFGIGVRSEDMPTEFSCLI